MGRRGVGGISWTIQKFHPAAIFPRNFNKFCPAQLRSCGCRLGYVPDAKVGRVVSAGDFDTPRRAVHTRLNDLADQWFLYSAIESKLDCLCIHFHNGGWISFLNVYNFNYKI